MGYHWREGTSAFPSTPVKSGSADPRRVVLQRLGGDYTPAVEGVLTREFAGRKLDRLDSWHVFMIAVDLGHQGSGKYLSRAAQARQ